MKFVFDRQKWLSFELLEVTEEQLERKHITQTAISYIVVAYERSQLIGCLVIVVLHNMLEEP